MFSPVLMILDNFPLLTELHNAFMRYDGGANIFAQLDLSGEPVIIQKQDDLGSGPEPPMPLLQYQDNCLRRKEYRASYTTY